MDNKSLSHTKWKCQYHIVFIPKYRKKILYGRVKNDVREIISTLCKYKDVDIIAGAVCVDHIHLSVAIPPKISISNFMGYLKGKSTLMKLLLGLYEPYEGNISIAGKNFCDNGVYEVRKQIAYVSQDTYLFNVSIKENIAYGKPSASDKEIIEAAKYACAHDFIMKLEKGYDTIVGEAGNILSGGECQRIAIARALSLIHI